MDNKNKVKKDEFIDMIKIHTECNVRMTEFRICCTCQDFYSLLPVLKQNEDIVKIDIDNTGVR